ncbi:fungal-specific transcription factor domain-containing protein [Aspergillus pseudoustus]|uniref:Fungal-specific transcription factor domain-containing protein n=1 Tax=Aspergillus pseudoustus TaxID=1810923 RepID=A0ABR4KDH0_9EURO
MSSAGPSTLSRPQRPLRTWEEPSTATRDPSRGVTKTYKRSRNGCYTCRLRRKKCDETHPSCLSCSSLGVSCEYRKPSWWISTQARTLQKEKIKQKVRETKVTQKELALQEYIRHVVPSSKAREAPAIEPPAPEPHSEPATATFDMPMSYLPTPTSAPLLSHNPYEFSAGVGGSAFVPDPSTIQDPSAFMFNMADPLIPTPTSLSSTSSGAVTTITDSATPALRSGEWYQGFADPPPRVQNTLGLRSSEFLSRPWSVYLEATMSANDRERSLLYHFVDNVLQLVFPILDVHKQQRSHVREILRSLDSNKSYYHCCLSVSAIHLKTVKKQRGRGVATDIMQHRYAAIGELCKAMYADNGHDTILDTTLAMIFFRCFVGSSEADGPKDVPWNEHYTSAIDLLNRLNLAEANTLTIPPFSVSLSAWIDILGATMLGQSPQFANTYRVKHVNEISSGLQELMGCEDRIMYLISEIACLEGMKREGIIDDYTLCRHAAILTGQIDDAEKSIPEPALENPMSTNGIVQADKLTKNTTAVFRVAARLYLYSIMPGFRHDDQSTMDMVQRIAELLQYIPSGPFGFDRALVWPMLIAGAFSTQHCDFRIILEQRIEGMGVCSEFGSFGRMYTVLQELWKLCDEDDDLPAAIYSDSALIASSSSSTAGLGFGHMAMPSPAIGTIGRRIKKQPLHWRDLMIARGWNYLLL